MTITEQPSIYQPAKQKNVGADVISEPLSIDEIIDSALARCEELPLSYAEYRQQIGELRSRLSHGRLHLAVVGEFNRGKSTFINSLIGMRLLPTSVLPITSVPTNIIYGKEISCTVRFLYDKPAIFVTASKEAVAAVLLKYVAENNNPNNQFGVRSVDVTVPAPLLENGTVLIDTPGFGSTYLHNTQTALSVLNDCDAVLFLLSVDPPMTQTEVEFLKLVVTHVPRIFFILNKIDLVSRKDLAMVDQFITGILSQKLPSSVKPNIFNISATHAGRAASQSASDTFWMQSGMEAVKNDIISFMAKEKYFTLSQALIDKLKEAIHGILSSLQLEQSDIEVPIVSLTQERNEIAKEADSIRKTLEKELSILAAEKKAIIKFFDEKLSAGRINLLRQIHETTDGLINESPCSAQSCAGITLALNKIIPETLRAFEIQTISGLNKPLKRAIQLHGKVYDDALESMSKCLTGTGAWQENRLYDKLDALELEPELQQRNDQKPFNITISLTLSDHFFSKQKRIRRLHTRYDHKIDENIKNDLFTFSKFVKGSIDAAFAALSDLLNAEYHQLALQLDQFTSHKERAIESHKAQTAASSDTLHSHINAFRELLTQLH